MVPGSAGEPVQRVAILQNQVVGDGEDLSMNLREALLQVGGDAEFRTDSIEEIGGTIVEPAVALRRRYRSRWCSSRRYSRSGPLFGMTAPV